MTTTGSGSASEPAPADHAQSHDVCEAFGTGVERYTLRRKYVIAAERRAFRDDFHQRSGVCHETSTLHPLNRLQAADHLVRVRLPRRDIPILRPRERDCEREDAIRMEALRVCVQPPETL